MFNYCFQKCFTNNNNDTMSVKNNELVKQPINTILTNFDHKSIKLFSFKDLKTICRVVDVYDGDTCTIIFDFKGEIIKYKVRCMGYDSPEMKPSLKNENREEEKAKAKEAKAYFQELVNFNNNGLTFIHIHEFDKYGRLLGTFYKDSSFSGDSINTIMINSGHGYSYFGGTKEKFKS